MDGATSGGVFYSGYSQILRKSVGASEDVFRKVENRYSSTTEDQSKTEKNQWFIISSLRACE